MLNALIVIPKEWLTLGCFMCVERERFSLMPLLKLKVVTSYALYILLIVLIVPTILSAEVRKFSFQGVTYTIDTTTAFCKFNAEQEAEFENIQRLLKESGQTPNILGAFACSNFKQFPFSNINVRWQTRIPSGYSKATVKKALEDNLKQQSGVAIRSESIFKNSGSAMQSIAMLETQNDQAIMYSLMLSSVPNSNEKVNTESFSSYTHVESTGDIFIVTLTTPKTSNLPEVKELLQLLGQISNSLSNNG